MAAGLVLVWPILSCEGQHHRNICENPLVSTDGVTQRVDGVFGPFGHLTGLEDERVLLGKEAVIAAGCTGGRNAQETVLTHVDHGFSIPRQSRG